MKKLLTLFLTLAMVLSLAACGGTGTTEGSTGNQGTSSGEESGASGEVQDVTLTVWSPAEDQSDDLGNWLKTCMDNFAAAHPEFNITWVTGVCPESEVNQLITQDPDAAADVFLYANDQINDLMIAGALMKFGGTYAEEIKASSSEAIVDSVTVDGEIYGVPFTTNTWYMFYDKSVFSDVSNLETMLEAGKVSFPMTNSWYLPAFYVGNGCTLFGNANDEAAGVDFGGDKAVEVTDYLIDLYSNPNFVVDADGSGIAGLRDGSVSAMFTGSWEAAAIAEILGENMGVAALPTYTLNGNQVQMMAYAGSKAVGVNANSKAPAAAIQFAMYLGSAEAQQLHYELRGVIPCNTELLADETISADPVVIAQNDTFDRTSILQPFVGAMANCWTPVENLGKGIQSGAISHDNSAEQTEAMNQSMNSTGIS